MSSTNRGYNRHVSDWYETPVIEIEKFLNAYPVEGEILDPCAGGSLSESRDMPYPKALVRSGIPGSFITTNDIRPDSPAKYNKNYLDESPDSDLLFYRLTYDTIIMNPPFNQALEFIKKALYDVRNYGQVIALLRLNFWGSKERLSFFRENMPSYCFIHPKRISFIHRDIHTGMVNKKGKEIVLKKGSTDSCEYAHFVWKKGSKPKFTETRLLDY